MQQVNSVADLGWVISRIRNESPFYRGQRSRYLGINVSISRELGHLGNEHSSYPDVLSEIKHEEHELVQTKWRYVL